MLFILCYLMTRAQSVFDRSNYRISFDQCVESLSDCQKRRQVVPWDGESGTSSGCSGGLKFLFFMGGMSS